MPRAIFTADQVHFLQAFRLFALDVVTAAFNTHFGADKTKTAIKSAYSNHGIHRERAALGRESGHTPVYTAERIAFLKENYPRMTCQEMTAAFNARFGTDISPAAIHSTCGRYGIHAGGRNGRFEKGHTTWNTGTKGICRANSGTFKKGNLPANHKPLYTERITKDGYVEISVPERNPHTGFESRYKLKHLWLWEQANGPLPKGHCILFLDSDKRNLAPENLVCIHRNVLLSLNLHKYAAAPAEVKPSILALAKLEAEAGIRTARAPGSGRKKKVNP